MFEITERMMGWILVIAFALAVLFFWPSLVSLFISLFVMM
jgi:hypothetical protein